MLRSVHRYASHLAHHADADVAVDVAADHIELELRGLVPSLVIVAASDHFRDEADAVRRAVVRRFPAAAVAGAVIPGGVIGVREETERQPAISLLAAVLPEGAAAVVELDHPEEVPDDADTLAVFADPFTVEAERLLDRADRLVAARRLLAEAVGCVCLQGHGWTVLHGGVVPGAGLVGTSDHDKIHLKAAPGETPWWELYDGRDGLLIVGHKPLLEPLMLRRDGRPLVVNVDTGCAYGGALTGYCIEEDRFLQVASQQPPREGFTTAAVATAPQWASAVPGRSFARRP